jgi:hypothetical protein
MPDLNANDIDAAMKIVEGTARNMGVTVKDWSTHIVGRSLASLLTQGENHE